MKSNTRWFVLASLALSGLGTPLSQAQSTPTLDVALFDRNQAKWLEEMAPKCGVNVKVTVTASIAHHDRLRIALQSGGVGAPDIAGIETGVVGTFFRGGGDAGLLELGPWIRGQQGAAANLLASRQAAYVAGGKSYGIETQVTPVVLYYRADLWEAAGVDPNRLATWEDFVAASKQVIAKNPGVITMPIFPNLHSVLMRQQGVDLFDQVGNPQIDSKVGISTQQWLLERIKDGTGAPVAGALASALAPEDYAMLRSNKWASIIGADWYISFLRDNVPELAGKWRAAPLPAWSKGGRRTSAFGGTGLFIIKTSKNIDAAKKLLDCALLSTEGRVSFFEVTNAFPAWKAAWKDPRVQQGIPYLGGQRVAQLFQSIASRVPASYPSPYRTLTREQYMAGLRNLYDGKISAEQHLRNVGKAVRDEIKRSGR